MNVRRPRIKSIRNAVRVRSRSRVPQKVPVKTLIILWNVSHRKCTYWCTSIGQTNIQALLEKRYYTAKCVRKKCHVQRSFKILRYTRKVTYLRDCLTSGQIKLERRLLDKNPGYDTLSIIEAYINGISTVRLITIISNTSSTVSWHPVMLSSRFLR